MPKRKNPCVRCGADVDVNSDSQDKQHAYIIVYLGKKAKSYSYLLCPSCMEKFALFLKPEIQEEKNASSPSKKSGYGCSINPEFRSPDKPSGQKNKRVGTPTPHEIPPSITIETRRKVCEYVQRNTMTVGEIAKRLKITQADVAAIYNNWVDTEFLKEYLECKQMVGMCNALLKANWEPHRIIAELDERKFKMPNSAKPGKYSKCMFHLWGKGTWNEFVARVRNGEGAKWTHEDLSEE